MMRDISYNTSNLHADPYWVAKIRCFFLNTEKSSIKKGAVPKKNTTFTPV